MKRLGKVKAFAPHPASRTLACFCLLAGLSHAADQPAAEVNKNRPVKVFILAGDENVLEQGAVEGRTGGIHEDFYPNAAPTNDEQKKHVNAAVYRGDYAPGTDYDTLMPEVTGLVEIGDQRTRRASPKERGRVPIPMARFPEPANRAGYTTVLRGYVAVKYSGKYEFRPGTGDAAFNVTVVEGKEVYRRNIGQAEPHVLPVELGPNTRYAFKTVFFKKPGHAFRLPLIDKPGTLTTVVAENPRYAFLKDNHGQWVTRNDVLLYDAHPMHNNTEAPARPLGVGVMVNSGPETGSMMGVDLMLGHSLGDAYEEPIMLLRFGTRHPIWFQRGSRDLGHDYRPPSSGGGSDSKGSWDVIHFNFGVWDATYREATSKYFSGYSITPVEAFEKNLRTLVARMKKTGATLIWGTVTPVWEGEPGKLNADEDAFNAVAEKVMKENDVIINDLNAEVRRQGHPKSDNVHSVGNLAPKVTETVLDAIRMREQSTKPLPRVLLIGDSITGSYQKQVFQNLDGKAAVFKNPGNAEDTGQGAALAGMIWFQGTADVRSSSKATAYEKHMVNLIRDLRKDLNAPKLPVVVTALANSNGAMTDNQQRVFDAQMAVGDKDRYPEFAGNVISIDTRPACRPLAQSPGGRDPYVGNAETYLEIGAAMGQAVLKLIRNE